MSRYRQLRDIINFCQPKLIIEIGTNQGARAEMMCRAALKHHEKVHYVGYDLFEDATAENDELEHNGKSHSVEKQVSARLSAIPGLTFELVRGNTRKTLHGTDQYADFVFIDGGHSVETIRGDYEAVKSSPVIVFDDYYTAKVDTSKFGCNKVVEGLPHEVLPIADGNTRLAAVGYSVKWRAAFENIREKDPIKSIALYRPEMRTSHHMIAAINCLEHLIDPGETLEDIRKLCKRRFFFVIKADAIRSLGWWSEEIAKKFEIREWFGSETEIVGTAVPYNVEGEKRVRGVLSDEERANNMVENSRRVKKRFVPAEEPTGNRALIVCYGPSLLETWPHLLAQLKFHGGDVFSVSGSHDFVVRRGVVPKYHVECDPRPHKTANINMMQEGTEYLIASCAHPSLIEKLEPYNLTLWHSLNGMDSIRVCEEIEPDQPLIGGGGNAGLRAITLAFEMGYRYFTIYGMDCSFKSGAQWAGPHTGKIKEAYEVKTPDGRTFESSAVMVAYTRHFFETVQKIKEACPWAEFQLAGDGLLQHMITIQNQMEKAA